MLERIKAGKRDERSRFRQGAEQADKATLYPTKGSSELRSHL